MKLVVLFCLEDFVEDARNLFIDHKVTFFTETDMESFVLQEEEVDESDNWFADRHVMNAGHGFFTVCKEEKADELMTAIETCKTDKGRTLVKSFKVDVERYIA